MLQLQNTEIPILTMAKLKMFAYGLENSDSIISDLMIKQWFSQQVSSHFWGNKIQKY
jgi:hypothetical protein